jgi:hypothetical protein
MNKSCNIFIFKNGVLIWLSAEAWKCFRCNLTFKEEPHAKLHEELSKHSVRTVKIFEI